MIRAYDKGELAKDILLVLASSTVAIGLTFVFCALPGLAHISKLFKAKTGKDNFRLRQSVRTLERRGFVSITKKGGVETVVITPLGKIRAKQYSVEQARPPKPARWDGKWRLVMFDIPEKKRSARDALRFAFREMGLIQIQKSIFIYPYPCQKEVDFIAKYFQIRKGIIYATADKLDNEPHLKKKYKL